MFTPAALCSQLLFRPELFLIEGTRYCIRRLYRGLWPTRKILCIILPQNTWPELYCIKVDKHLLLLHSAHQEGYVLLKYRQLKGRDLMTLSNIVDISEYCHISFPEIGPVIMYHDIPFSAHQMLRTCYWFWHLVDIISFFASSDMRRFLGIWPEPDSPSSNNIFTLCQKWFHGQKINKHFGVLFCVWGYRYNVEQLLF